MSQKICNVISRAAVVGILLSGWTAVEAQYLISTNPADRGDPRAGFMNPAMAANQDRLLSVGSRVLFYGASTRSLDLTHSYFNYSASHRAWGGFEDLGVGIQGQVLQTPMFNAMALNALLAKQWREKFAVGATLGFANRAFDQSTFILEADNDPALNNLSKWIFPDLGIGFLAVPSRHLTLGFSVNHINQPDLALADSVDARLPRSFSGGAAIGFGTSQNSFRALFSVAYDEKEVLPRFALEGYREGLGSLMAGLGREAAFLDAKLHVLDGVALNFRYSYPLNELNIASSGSPELGLVFNFDKGFALYEMEWTKPPKPLPPAISLAHAYLAKSAFDTLFITEKYLKRTIDPAISKEFLAALPERIFFSADQDSILPLEPEKIFLTEEELLRRPKIGAATLLQKIEDRDRAAGIPAIANDSIAIVAKMKGYHSEAYMATFEKLARRLQTSPEAKGNFVTPRDPKRAELLLRYLSLFTTLNDNIKVTVEDSASQARNEQEKLGTKEIPLSERRIAVRAYRKTSGNGRGVLVNAPADTFRFSLNMQETKRWGPVRATFFLKNASGQIVLQDTALVAESREHNQILPFLVWNWRMPDSSYAPEGMYYYYIVWESADRGKLYRSPEGQIRIEHNRIASEIRLSPVMPEVNPKARVRTLIRLNE